MLVSGDCVNRAAIIAAIVTSILPFSSPSLAASDAEMAGDKMTGAFRCLTYARMFHDYKEEQRLFQIGVKAGREFAEQFRSDPKFSEITAYVPSTDFLVGIMYNEQTTKAHDEIVIHDNGVPLNKWLDPDEAKVQAQTTYRQSNCSLIK